MIIFFFLIFFDEYRIVKGVVVWILDARYWILNVCGGFYACFPGGNFQYFKISFRVLIARLTSERLMLPIFFTSRSFEIDRI
jgi:hypothetical protein